MTYLLFVLLLVGVPLGILTLWRARHHDHLTAHASVRWLMMGTAVPAIVWDQQAAHWGMWHWSTLLTLGWRWWGLPVEEVAFILLLVLVIVTLCDALRRLPPLPAPWRRVAHVLMAAMLGAGLGCALWAWRLALLPERTHPMYLTYLMMWALPLVLLQWLVGGRSLWQSRTVLLGVTLSVTIWYTLADALAVRAGIWSFAAGDLTGTHVGNVPSEEIVFFASVALLVAQTYLILLSGGGSSVVSDMSRRRVMVVSGGDGIAGTAVTGGNRPRNGFSTHIRRRRMPTLAQRLAPSGVVQLPAEPSPLRAAIYTLAGRLTARDWATLYGDLEWEKAATHLRDPALVYPDYYLCNRHGVHGGYLTGWHAIGWSVAAAFYGIAPIYRQLARHVAAQAPADARILDIGAGTGEWLIDLHALLPTAPLLAADLSPLMLAAVARRWERQGYAASEMHLLHAAGEHLPLADASCDIVTALLVLHELPPAATQALFIEARRVLKPGGIFLTLDAIQHPIPLPWLNALGVRAVAALFHEPDFRSYSHLDLPALALATGFDTVRQRFVGRLPWKFQIQEVS